MKITEAVGGFFALDVGLDSMRLAQMVGNEQRGWLLEAFADMPIDRRKTQDDSEASRINIGEMLVNAVQNSAIKEKKLVVGLPKQKVFTGVVEIAAHEKDTKTIEKLVKYQANQFIPLNVDEVKIDYAVLGPALNDLSKTEVLISAVKETEAESWINIVERHGFELVALEPSDVAMTRALMPQGIEQLGLIVFMREIDTTIVMTYKGKPHLFRSIAFGFDGLLTNVAQKLNMQKSEARQLMTSAGFFTDKYDGQVAKILDEEMTKMISEIMEVANYIILKYPGLQIEELIAGGFLTTIPAIAKYLQLKLGVAVKLGNPFQRVDLTPQQKAALESVAGEFTVACGLAERTNL